MVALALFYQTPAIHLLFFCNRGSVPITESMISHSTSCSRFSHCVMSWGTRLNYSDLEIIMAWLAHSSDGIPPNFRTSRLRALPLPLLSRPSASFREPISCHRSISNTAREGRSLAACVSRRKSLVPSQISDHRFSARSPFVVEHF